VYDHSSNSDCHRPLLHREYCDGTDDLTSDRSDHTDAGGSRFPIFQREHRTEHHTRFTGRLIDPSDRLPCDYDDAFHFIECIQFSGDEHVEPLSDQP